MHSNHMTIEYDTSLKKYPFNKYYDYKDLNCISRKVFDQKVHSKTIDAHPYKSKISFNNSKKQSKRQSRKSVNTAKTMSSSRLRHKINPNLSITIDNYKQHNKQEIAEQLHHYTKLCLKLRKQNHDLKQHLNQSKATNKQQILELQRRINKLNEVNLEIRQKQFNEYQNKAVRQNKLPKKSKQNVPESKQRVARDSQFKRFFLHFIDNYGRVDEKLQRKLTQKGIQNKMALGQKILKQSCEFLKEKKYKFNCIFE